MSTRLTNKEFIKKSMLNHGDRYDYSKVEYINDIKKVIIICKEHGDYQQKPNVHYRSGCPKCGLVRRSIIRKNDINKLISKFNEKHNNKYDYSKMSYIKMREKVIIICKEHNIEFLQSPEKHLHSKTGGCPKCNTIGKGRLSKDLFIEKSNKTHSDRYDYSKVEYILSSKKVIITCKNHGDFKITPNSHLMGEGCRRCNRNGGVMENNWLDSLNIHKDYRQWKIENFYVDGINLENNIIYEFYGDFWHGNPEVYKQEDINCVNGIRHGELFRKTIERENYLKSLGYEIISIWESEYKKIYK